MSKHAPGPWMVLDTPESMYAPFWIVAKSNVSLAAKMRVASIDDEPEARANARLIAAAPELLEALKQLLRQVDESGNGDASDFGWPSATHAARAAIAKAEGQS